MPIKQPVIASASVAIPLSKVRGIYSDHYSNGLPRHFVPRNDNDYGDSSVGYFACAQYDVKNKSVAEMRTIFLRKQKNPSVPLPAQTKKASRSLSSGGFVVGAGNENRTRNRSLGSSYFTTKLCPHISGCISHATLLLYFTIFAVILQAFWRRF